MAQAFVSVVLVVVVILNRIGGASERGEGADWHLASQVEKRRFADGGCKPGSKLARKVRALCNTIVERSSELCYTYV